MYGLAVRNLCQRARSRRPTTAGPRLAWSPVAAPYACHGAGTGAKTWEGRVRMAAERARPPDPAAGRNRVRDAILVVRVGRWGRFLRYSFGSALASATSAVVLALCYDRAGLGPRRSSIAAFVTGALVNFAASRFWAFGRRQRRGVSRDVAGYAAIAVSTALVAVAVTGITERYARQAGLAPTARTLVVEGSYFAVYAAMFLVKFVLLDRVLFAARTGHPAADRTGDRAADRTGDRAVPTAGPAAGVGAGTGHPAAGLNGGTAPPCLPAPVPPAAVRSPRDADPDAPAATW